MKSAYLHVQHVPLTSRSWILTSHHWIGYGHRRTNHTVRFLWHQLRTQVTKSQVDTAQSEANAFKSISVNIPGTPQNYISPNYNWQIAETPKQYPLCGFNGGEKVDEITDTCLYDLLLLYDLLICCILICRSLSSHSTNPSSQPITSRHQ